MNTTTEVRFTDPQWAVFNCHVNDAKQRALSVVQSRYPDSDGLKELEKYVEDGVMGIFAKRSTPEAELFANACYIFTNGF